MDEKKTVRLSVSLWLLTYCLKILDSIKYSILMRRYKPVAISNHVYLLRVLSHKVNLTCKLMDNLFTRQISWLYQK